jgi:hypothetical protein
LQIYYISNISKYFRQAGDLITTKEDLDSDFGISIFTDVVKKIK